MRDVKYAESCGSISMNFISTCEKERGGEGRREEGAGRVGRGGEGRMRLTADRCTSLQVRTTHLYSREHNSCVSVGETRGHSLTDALCLAIILWLPKKKRR